MACPPGPLLPLGRARGSCSPAVRVQPSARTAGIHWPVPTARGSVPRPEEDEARSFRREKGPRFGPICHHQCCQED